MNKREEDIKMAASGTKLLYFNFRWPPQTRINQIRFLKRIKDKEKKQSEKLYVAIVGHVLDMLQEYQRLLEFLEKQATSINLHRQLKNTCQVGRAKTTSRRIQKPRFLPQFPSRISWSDGQICSDIKDLKKSPQGQKRSSVTTRKSKDVKEKKSSPRRCDLLSTPESLPKFRFNRQEWKEEWVHEDDTTTGKSSLLDEEWNEWSDEEEPVRQKMCEEKPRDEQKTEKGEGAGLHASEERKSQRRQTGSPERKIATWVKGFFDRRTSFKWKKFKNES